MSGKNYDKVQNYRKILERDLQVFNIILIASSNTKQKNKTSDPQRPFALVWETQWLWNND